MTGEAEPIAFSERDPARAAKEARLAALDDAGLAHLLAVTRRAAAQARAAQAMERLFDLVRGMKTIQRVAHGRGLILRRPGSADGP